MKKIITLFFVFAMIFVFSKIVKSQSFAINGYSFYSFDDNIETVNGINYLNGTVKANLLWGAGLEYRPYPFYGLELIYFRQDTDFPADYYIGGILPQHDNFKIASNFIFLSGNRYLNIPNSRLEPYFGGMLGLGFFENKGPLLPGAENSTTNFAWGLKAGLNIMASKQVGIKFQMQLLSAVQTIGGGLFLGTGGVGAGISTNSTILQFSLGGGLTFRFSK